MRLRHGRRAAALSLLSAALAAGCGGGDSRQAGGTGGGSGGGGCKAADKALTDAARAHVGPLKVARSGAGAVSAITLQVCRSTDEDATAVVLVEGMHDPLIRDVRHQVRLIKTGGLWQVTDDVDARRCQPGHGHQDFSGDTCH